MEFLEWLQVASASASKNGGSINITFMLYVAISILIKKSRYLLAFFFSDLLIACSIFDYLQEHQIYLTSFIVYSYIATQDIPKKTKMACVIMCILDLTLANDAFKYGIGGTHGTSETLIYQNIEYLAFYANLIIIISLVPFGRIYDCICRLLDYAFSVKSHSTYMLVFWYTINKIQTIKPN